MGWPASSALGQLVNAMSLGGIGVDYDGFLGRRRMVGCRLLDKKGVRPFNALLGGVAYSLTHLRLGAGAFRGRSGVHYRGCRQVAAGYGA